MGQDSSPFAVFYSWQSQLPNATNRGFIEQALEIAIKDIHKDVTLDVRPDLDQDTKNVGGSPNIADTIRAKIDAAEVFVCDASIVQGKDGDGKRVRPVPNANVLIELGYAMKALGSMERVVLVMNTAFGAIEDLPFDLRQNRPTTYELAEGAADKGEVRKTLAGKFEKTLRLAMQMPRRKAAPASPLALDLKYKKLPGSSGEEHLYQLVASVENTSKTRVSDWYVEVELPEVLLDPGAKLAAHVRTVDGIALLRTGDLKPLLSGDAYPYRVPYRVNRELYWKLGPKLQKMKAIARVFVDGTQVQEASLDDIEEF